MRTRTTLDQIKLCPLRHQVGDQIVHELFTHVFPNIVANAWLVAVIFPDDSEFVFVWGDNGMTDASWAVGEFHHRIDVVDDMYRLDQHFAEYVRHTVNYSLLARAL